MFLSIAFRAQGITIFKYYCKRFYEEFRLNNDKSYDDTPIAIADVDEDNGGCFGTGEQDSNTL